MDEYKSGVYCPRCEDKVDAKLHTFNGSGAPTGYYCEKCGLNLSKKKGESTMQDNPMQDENELKNNNGEDEIAYEVRADCPMCDGTGKVDGEECTVCNGGGKIDIGESMPDTNTNFYQWWESLQPDKRQEIANSVGTLDEVGNKDWTQLHVQDQQAIHAKYIRDGGNEVECELCGNDFPSEDEMIDHRIAMSVKYNYKDPKYPASEELDLDKWLEEQEKQDKLQKAWDLRDAEKFLNEENFGKPYNNEDIPGEILINQNVISDTPFNEVDANNMEDGSNTSDFVNGGDADYKDIRGEATPTDSERWNMFTYTQKWDSIKPLQVTFSLSEDEVQTMANGNWEDLPPAMKHELSLTGYNPDNEDLYSQNEAGPADITMDVVNGKGKEDRRRDIEPSESPNLELQNTIEQLSGGDNQLTDFVGAEGLLEKAFGNGSQLNYCKFCNSTEDFRSGACARCQKPYSK